MGYYSKLVEDINTPIFYLDKSGILEFANPSFLEYLQLDALPKKNLSLILGLDGSKFKKLLGDAIKTKTDQKIEFDRPNDSSEHDPLQVILFPETNGSEIIGFSGRLKESELDKYAKILGNIESNEISELEKKYNTLYNLTFEGMIIHDAGVVIDANPAFCRISGFSYDEVIGSNIIALCVLPEYHEKAFDAMKKESTLPYEVRSRRKDGTIFYNEVESRKINIGQRSLRVTAIRDIDARKRAELELRESEERYRLLSNITFEGIFIHRNGVVLDANQSLAKMIGYDLDEIVGKNIIQLVVLPEYHQRVIQALKNEETSPYEVKVKRKDGTEFFTEIEAGMVYYHGEYVRVTAARDISWRKDAEKKLRENEEELDSFFLRSEDGFFIMKIDSALEWHDNVDKSETIEHIFSGMYLNKVNNALLIQYGTTDEKIKDFTLKQFIERSNLNSSEFVLNLLNEGTINFEASEQKPDGTSNWIEGNYVVLYDESDKVRGICGVRRDITDRKYAEEEIKLHNEELKKTNQELDNFVYRVSHDLKAPIASTKGLIHIARIEKDEERISECLELIEKSMNKLDSFILDILDYSRNSRIAIEPELINFDALIEDVLLNLKFLQTENKVRIQKEMDQALKFYSDKRRLIFIFNNLISNAIRFSDHKKTDSYLIIRIKKAKNNVVISFIDNGIGIDQEHHEHIFGMFYRANETRVGSGLGLYIVKEAVDKLNGLIEVDSKAKKGTTFKITVPNLSI